MRLNKEGTHQGYEYRVIAMDTGCRCGYVRIPEEHPLYNSTDKCWEFPLFVHGGITFSEMIKDNHPILSNGYWIGFDCGHIFDEPDPDEMSKEWMEAHKRSKQILNQFGRFET